MEFIRLSLIRILVEGSTNGTQHEKIHIFIKIHYFILINLERFVSEIRREYDLVKTTEYLSN